MAKKNTECELETEVLIIDENYIKNRIYMIRGQKVMLDYELAEIYGYTTTRFNEQVKNNIEKFDNDFMFQLTKEEFGTLMSQGLISKNSTSNRGGRTKPPKVFTEQGIYMLMTVLKGEKATVQSKALIRTFKKMKDFIIENQGLIGQREWDIKYADREDILGSEYIVIPRDEKSTYKKYTYKSVDDDKFDGYEKFCELLIENGYSLKNSYDESVYIYSMYSS